MHSIGGDGLQVRGESQNKSVTNGYCSDYSQRTGEAEFGKRERWTK